MVRLATAEVRVVATAEVAEAKCQFGLMLTIAT